jgi:hypothetical protein
MENWKDYENSSDTKFDNISADLASFANFWLKNIKDQQSL